MFHLLESACETVALLVNMPLVRQRFYAGRYIFKRDFERCQRTVRKWNMMTRTSYCLFSLCEMVFPTTKMSAYTSDLLAETIDNQSRLAHRRLVCVHCSLMWAQTEIISCEHYVAANIHVSYNQLCVRNLSRLWHSLIHCQVLFHRSMDVALSRILFSRC